MTTPREARAAAATIPAAAGEGEDGRARRATGHGLVQVAGPLAPESPYADESAERRQGKRLRLEATPQRSPARPTFCEALCRDFCQDPPQGRGCLLDVASAGLGHTVTARLGPTSLWLRRPPDCSAGQSSRFPE